MKQKSRILARTVAKELSPEELKNVGGSLAEQQIEKDPPVSTLVATLPDYNEDR